MRKDAKSVLQSAAFCWPLIVYIIVVPSHKKSPIASNASLR